MPADILLTKLAEDPKFKQLPPDQQQQFLAKAQAKIAAWPEEKKQQVYQKFGIQEPKQPGMVSKVWGAMGKPAEMSQQGLNQYMDLHTNAQNALAEKTGLPIGTEPTGNMARDIAANIPRIAGESVAEVAPSFIDKTAILTAGAGAALKTAGKVAGKVIPKVAPMLEAGSGLQKGTLEAAFKDPKMIADFGSKLKASELYNSIKEGATVPARLKTNAKVVSDAMNQLSQGKVLSAPDAFKARKAVNALMKSKQYPTDDLLQLKEGLEKMVFGSAKEADKLYIRAIRGEQMRNISRLNKNGTTGPISAGIMAKVPLLAPLISPAVQGLGASGAGAAAQLAPRTIAGAGAVAGGLNEAFQSIMGRRKKLKGRN